MVLVLSALLMINIQMCKSHGEMTPYLLNRQNSLSVEVSRLCQPSTSRYPAEVGAATVGKRVTPTSRALKQLAQEVRAVTAGTHTHSATCSVTVGLTLLLNAPSPSHSGCHRGSCCHLFVPKPPPLGHFSPCDQVVDLQAHICSCFYPARTSLLVLCRSQTHSHLRT